MDPIKSEDPIANSADIVAGNIARLKQFFPEASKEGKLDFDVLKQLLGGQIDESDEKYGLNWHGKRRARQIALTPSTGTLRPCPEDSVDWDKTKNLMIEGDNLEVLKLLQKSYAGKVKLIYIDPPYNTGKDFVYPDNFQDSIKNYLELTGQSGEGGKKLTSNQESSGRYHTDWLNMMYPRLSLARQLIKKDGAIFLSCDEGEQARVRLVMDEIFGEENFVADIVWAAGRKNDSKYISVSHEYIICYARDLAWLRENKIEWKQRKKGLEAIYKKLEELTSENGANYQKSTLELKAWFKSLPDGAPEKAHQHYSHVDRRGVFFPGDISWPGGGGPRYEVINPKTGRPVKCPSRGWIVSEARMKEWISEDKVHFGEGQDSVPCVKRYLKNTEMEAPYSVFYQDGRAASKRLRALMGKDVFDFPKDELILRELIEMITSEDDIILDFFAGSGTTGHAVLLQNAASGGRRNYVLVQIPEKLDDSNESQLEAIEFCDEIRAPRNIASLTKERLRRCGKQVKLDHPMFAGDAGFRVFKLDSTNIREWDPDGTKIADSLEAHVEHMKQGRSEQDILFELLLKLGLDLCVPIEKKKVAGKEIHSIGSGVLIACLASSVTQDDVEALAQGIVAWLKELKPAGESTIVFRDNAFSDDIAKTNLTSILNQNGLHNVRSL